MVEAAKNGLEYRPRPDSKTWSLVRKGTRLVLEVSPGAENSPELIELASLLNLQPGLPRYEVVVTPRFGPDPARFPSPPASTLSVVPRSTLQAYFYMSNGVEVPEEHFRDGLVVPVLGPEGNPMDGREITAGLFEVRSCKGHKPPKSAYVAVKYRGYWFYIDDSDRASKSTLALMMQLSRLDFHRQRPGLALTLPVGR
jgi:hypothetical protein